MTSSSSPSSIIGKTILITGGGSGLGEVSALYLASQGANVVITGRREANLKQVAEKASGGKIVPIVADVTNESDWERVISTITGQFGGLDSAIMNAAWEGPTNQDPIDASTTEIKELLSINIYGPILAARFCVPELIKSKGTFIIVSSVAGTLPRTSGFSGLYSVTKAAVDQQVRQFSAIYFPKGVRVFGVDPMVYESPMVHNALKNVAIQALDIKTPEAFGAMINPLGKLGDPVDIAVVFHSLLTNTTYKSGDCVATLPSIRPGKPLTVEMSFFYTNVVTSSAPDAMLKCFLTLPLNNERGEPLSPGDADPIRQEIIANNERAKSLFTAMLSKLQAKQ